MGRTILASESKGYSELLVSLIVNLQIKIF